MQERISMVRLNITIPENLIEQLKNVRNKSRFIAQALQEKLQREQKKKLESLLIEGYKKSNQEDSSIAQEWGHIDLNEGWE